VIIIVIFNKEHHFAVGYNKEEIIDYMKQHYPDYLYNGVIRVCGSTGVSLTTCDFKKVK